MHTVAKVGHEHTLQSLVKKGADTSIKDNDGVSLLLVMDRKEAVGGGKRGEYASLKLSCLQTTLILTFN